MGRVSKYIWLLLLAQYNNAMFKEISPTHRLLWVLTVLAVACLLPTFVFAQEQKPVEDPVMTIIRERVGAYRQSVGMVVGITRGYGRWTHAYGTLDRGTIRRVSNSSVFEIGAITGVMTGTLLAHMVETGDVSLSDPVSMFLPEAVRMPTRNGQAITLQHLATHTSGLPALADSISLEETQNPLATFTVDNMYAFLSSHTLTRDIGSTYEYSELGMALLGHVLSVKGEKSFDEILHERLFGMLKMTNTHVVPTLGMKAQTPTGHDMALRPMEPSVLPPMPAAAGMHSTAHDLNIFVSAAMGFIYAFPMLPEDDKSDSVKIAAAFETTNRALYPTGRENEEIALGWLVRTVGENVIHWQHSMTRGFSTFIGFDKRRRRGVVVLSNAANGVDDVGFHLLNSTYRLRPPPRAARAFISPQAYDTYTGLYEFQPHLTVTVSRDGTKLFGQPPGQVRNELIPRSGGEFYLREEDAQITFVKDESGTVTHMLFLKDGRTHRANKVR